MTVERASVGLSLIGYNLTSRELTELARTAEASGLASLWTADYFRSAIVQAALVASATDRIRIGTGIALAFVRSPLATALAALDLDEASDGRFVLGLGTQVKAVMERWHGLAHGRPAARMADCVGAIRAAWHAGESAQAKYEGEFYRFDLTDFQRPLPARRDVPIYLAAAGPIMVRTACAVGDGVLGHIFWSDRYFDAVVRPALETRAATSEEPRAFETCATIVASVAGDEALARLEAKRTIGFYAATGTYRQMLDDDGFAAEAFRARAALMARDERALGEAITDDMLETYALAGTPLQVQEQLAARRLDVETVVLVPAYFRTPQERLRTLMEELIDAFSANERAGVSTAARH